MNITRKSFTTIINATTDYFINNDIRHIDTFSYIVNDFAGILQITWIVKMGEYYNQEQTYIHYLREDVYSTEQEMIDSIIYLINKSLNNINN